MELENDRGTKRGRFATTVAGKDRSVRSNAIPQKQSYVATDYPGGRSRSVLRAYARAYTLLSPIHMHIGYRSKIKGPHRARPLHRTITITLAPLERHLVIFNLETIQYVGGDGER